MLKIEAIRSHIPVLQLPLCGAPILVQLVNFQQKLIEMTSVDDLEQAAQRYKLGY